jgi:hypothetical protein
MFVPCSISDSIQMKNTIRNSTIDKLFHIFMTNVITDQYMYLFLQISQWYQMSSPSPAFSHTESLIGENERKVLQSNVCLLQDTTIPQSSIKIQVAN